MCLYHVDLNSKPGEAGGIITDIAIQNPTDAAITFPSTSSYHYWSQRDYAWC